MNSISDGPPTSFGSGDLDSLDAERSSFDSSEDLDESSIDTDTSHSPADEPGMAEASRKRKPRGRRKEENPEELFATAMAMYELTDMQPFYDPQVLQSQLNMSHPSAESAGYPGGCNRPCTLAELV